MPDLHHTNATKKSSRTKERRNRVRAVISTPVRVRGVVGPDRNFDETTTTINLSPTGILIESASKAYYRTMRLCVTLAYEESSASVQPEQEGRVVRINELRDGLRSIAIALSHASAEEASGAHEEKPEKKREAEANTAAAPHAPAAPEAQAAAPRPPAQTSDAARPSLAPFILVVESESTASEFMKSYLCGEGYEVLTVRTSAEARSILDERIPSLLIAAIEGEGMPGFTLCSHCKETPRLKPVPVMLVTSSAYPSDYAKAHKLGAVVCMAKPYKRERLGHVVRLLAPPPHANQALPPRPPDASRQAAAKQSKVPPGNSSAARKFHLSSVFGR